MVDFIDVNGRRIAYCKTAGTGPGVVFLGGFKSDMDGTKAVFLEDWARAQGRNFLRFDYSGHGQSSARFVDGCIGDWAADALAVIDLLTEGPQVLVGSSMGGWISLLVARARPERVKGLVGIAAAPDFTEDSMWDGFSDEQKKELAEHGRVELPSEYSGDPYIITEKLINDGRAQLVLRAPLDLPFPVRLLHGTADEDVSMQVPLRIVEHVTCEDMQLTFVKGADHRFSDAACLALIVAVVAQVSQ
jgi:pimeloyl-ACP methyl ester carboxylesterase